MAESEPRGFFVGPKLIAFLVGIVSLAMSGIGVITYFNNQAYAQQTVVMRVDALESSTTASASRQAADIDRLAGNVDNLSESVNSLSSQVSRLAGIIEAQQTLRQSVFTRTSE